MAKKTPARQSADDILERLRVDGGRRTASRQAIIEVLVDADGHITAEEIAELVQQRFPSINASTVYRTLTALSDSGVVEHIHFGHGPATYHIADEKHQHLFCESCGAIQEIPATTVQPLQRTLEREYGFVADYRHFAIVGRCKRCSA